MEQAKYYEAVLEQHVLLLEAEIQALSPKGWAVPSLGESYAQGAALEAVRDLWDDEYYELCQSYQKALADHSYGEQKVQHLYL